jgi:tetratricopeptide (TPR) repeat protein
MNSSVAEVQNEGIRLFHEGAYGEALEHFYMALEKFEQSSQMLEVGEVLNNIGVICRIEGRLDESARSLERAKELFQTLGDRSREAQTLGNLAPLYRKQGLVEKALEAYSEASTLFKSLNDSDREGEILMALGILEFDLGRRSAGILDYEVGLGKILHPTGHQKRLHTLLQIRKFLFGG